MKKNKFLVVIPARKNSKRLKNKNILKINGKSLIQNTIDFALKLKNVQHVLISTDIRDIRKHILLTNQVLIPWIRPKELSKDESSTKDVLSHAINWYNNNFGKIDGIILLQTTSPIRSIKMANKVINNYMKFKKTSLTVQEIKSKIKLGTKYIKKKDKYYYPNGFIYVFPQNQILKKEIYNHNSNIVIDNNYYRNIDIDYKRDLIKAKKFFKKN